MIASIRNKTTGKMKSAEKTDARYQFVIEQHKQYQNVVFYPTKNAK